MAKRKRPPVTLTKDVLDAFRALGSIGGKLRWKNVPESARTAHARKAARARWGKAGAGKRARPAR